MTREGPALGVEGGRSLGPWPDGAAPPPPPDYRRSPSGRNVGRKLKGKRCGEAGASMGPKPQSPSRTKKCGSSSPTLCRPTPTWAQLAYHYWNRNMCLSVIRRAFYP